MKEIDKLWCVYIHRNKINNKAYIGITSKSPKERWGNNGHNYRKNQPVFYKAINKYGWDNFEHIIFAENLNKSEAVDMEIKLIALFKTNCIRYKNPELGYNMTDGGEGTLGRTHSDETKHIIGEKTRVRLSEPKNNPNYGKKASEETKKKQSKKQKERMSNPNNNPFYGRHHSDESKQKIREYALNRPIEVNQKLSEQAKKRTGEKNPNYGKGMFVVQLTPDGDFIAEYVSCCEAEKYTAINHRTIYDRCKHKTKTQIAGGYLWMSKEEYIETRNK